MSELNHFNDKGQAHMVDIGHKADTERRAKAQAIVKMNPETRAIIEEGSTKKGDVLGVARLAGIMGAKKTPDLIPLCHPLALTNVDIAFEFACDAPDLTIVATVKTAGKTGVEMEALTAVSTAALTVIDMCKAVDKTMTITDMCMTYKTGGKSGTFERT